MSAGGRARVLSLCTALALVLAGCGGSALAPPKRTESVPFRADLPAYLQDVAMTRPGGFKPPIVSADILVQSQTTLPASLLAAATSVKGVTASVQFALATFYREENAVTFAAVDPTTFRRFSYGPTAQLDQVWDRLADGEIAVDPAWKKILVNSTDFVAMGNDAGAEQAHVAAYAPLVERSHIAALVNARWAAKLHMPSGNALLLSTGNSAPLPILKKIRALAGKNATVQLLAPNVDPNAAQIAVLTGGSVSQAVGSFSYTANSDGTVNPDPKWISAYIRSEQVPIIGSVTCNKVMLVQLRAALTEVVKDGLASAIHPSEYGGCYVPRYIAKDPSKGLSFHTFGTAIDLNVPGNERGTVGTMNRTVVKIFERYGFNWGGYWSYTDPMHFELARLVTVK